MTPEETYLRTGFLERVAHDSRGAASVSIGALDEIDAILAEREDLGPLLAIVRRGLGRVLRISESLADAADLEHGHATAGAESMDFGRLAKDACERARTFERRRGIVLESRCEPLMAVVDGPRMARAIFELASNAIRHARANVMVETSANDVETTVAVSDDGAGCGPAAPRFTASTEGLGLGLGLAFAVGVAALHDGRLVVGRHEGRTLIQIVVPFRAATAA